MSLFQSQKEFLLKRLYQYAWLGLFLAIFMPMVSFFFYQIWWLDNLSHFRPFYATIALLTSLVLMTKRKWFAPGAFGFLVGLFFLYTVYGFYQYQEPTKKEADFQLISYNVLTGNQEKQAVNDFIRNQVSEQKGNIVFLMEVNKEWEKNLRELTDILPYSFFKPHEHNFGLAILSDFPIESTKLYKMDQLGLPVLKSFFRIKGREFTFWGVHTMPPVGAQEFQARKEYLSNLNKFLKDSGGNYLIAGDFNLTPFSGNFFELIKSFPDSTLMAGKKYSYQSSWNILFLGVLIDHVFYSGSFHLRDYRVGPKLGSDHRMIITKFHIR